MENKINIAELLKDCPKGMELDCTMFEGLEFDGIVDNEFLPIRCCVKHSDGGYNVYNFTKYGCWLDTTSAKCVIFPKGKTTWEGFVPPIEFKDGDVVISTNNNIHLISCRYKNNGWESYCCIIYGKFDSTKTIDVFPARLATEEEKQKLFDAIKANGYQWNAETKTLEKLIGPKFKEIHFYKDSIGIGYLHESALKTHNTTVLAIQTEWDTIYSYAISALNFSWLLDKGYRIFLHENGRCGELHEGTTELTDKELRKHHDIRKIWIGGGFEDFFYR